MNCLGGVMANLKAVLEKHCKISGLLGGTNGSSLKLSEDLVHLATHLRRLSWITSTMIMLVFVFELAVAFFYRENPTVLAGIGGAMGITIVGAIDRMSRLSKEYGKTILLINLCDRLPPNQTAKIVKVLVDKQ
jgi:hypothetical protein